MNLLDSHPRTRDTLSHVWQYTRDTGITLFTLLVIWVMFRGYFGDWLP
jgi:hypothetical protein